MQRRSYGGEADVTRLQRFNAESIAATGGCGHLHPGDVPLADSTTASSVLYRSAGFEPWRVMHGYVKPIARRI